MCDAAKEEKSKVGATWGYGDLGNKKRKISERQSKEIQGISMSAHSFL